MDGVKQVNSGEEIGIGLASVSLKRKAEKMLNYQTPLRVGTKPQKER